MDTFADFDYLFEVEGVLIAPLSNNHFENPSDLLSRITKDKGRPQSAASLNTNVMKLLVVIYNLSEVRF